MRTDPYDDLCLSCGYDLRGLKMPHACPECGELRDPERDEKKARDWFAKWRLSPLWPLRLCDTPPGLWYLLSDPKSQRIAQRRRFRWLWLPAIVAIFILCPATLIQVDYGVVTNFYESAASKSAPLKTIERTERFGFFLPNVRFDNIKHPYAQQYGWIEETKRSFRRVSFGTTRINLEPFFFGVLPLLAAVLGLYASHYLLLLLASRNSREVSSERQPASAMSSMLAPMLGLSLCGWFAMWMFHGFANVVDIHRKYVFLARSIRDVMALLSVGNLVLTCLGGWYLLLQMDDALLVVRRRVLTALLLTAISVGFPLGLVWALGKVL